MFGSWKKVLDTQDYIVVACQTIHDMNYYLLTLSTNHLDTLCGFPYNFGNYMLCVQWGTSDRLQYIEVWKEDSIEKKYTLLMHLALDFYGMRNVLSAYIYNNYVYIRFMVDNSTHYAKIPIPYTTYYAKCHKDRGIAAIRYNLLNLPDTIQFANGNQIIHTYDATGNRLRTSYHTRKVTTTVPLGNTLPVGTSANYYITRDIFHHNCVYHTYNTAGTDYSIEFVHNSEGYIRYYTEEEHYHFYCIKDHLGSIRETYVRPSANYKECIQRMQYYPSGLPWNTNYVANEQPYKYGGKEFVEMHGLDEYDSHARWYYPAMVRTTTMDPHSEDYYPISPYSWCGNNFVNNVDRNGKDIIIVGNDSINTIYNPNVLYNGNDDFTEKVYSDISAIYSTENGSVVLNKLINSNEHYIYNSQNVGTIGTRGFISNKIGGGTIKLGDDFSMDQVAHESFHGYQQAMGQGGRSIFNEVEAYLFAFGIVATYGYSHQQIPEGSPLFSKDGLDLQYEHAVNSLIWNGYNIPNFQIVLNGFLVNSRANMNGVYNTYPMQRPNQVNSLIQPLYPLVR